MRRTVPITASSTRSPSSVNPQASARPPRAARTNREEGRVEEQHDQPDVVQARRMNGSKRSRSSAQIRDAVDFDELPQPGLLAQRLDVTHRQAAHERADHQRLQRLGRATACAPAGTTSTRTARPPRVTCGISISKLPLRGLHMPGAEPVAHPRVVVAQPALPSGRRSYLRPAQPRVELVLDRSLNDQPRAQPSRAPTTSSAGSSTSPHASNLSI